MLGHSRGAINCKPQAGRYLEELEHHMTGHGVKSVKDSLLKAIDNWRQQAPGKLPTTPDRRKTICSLPRVYDMRSCRAARPLENDMTHDGVAYFWRQADDIGQLTGVAEWKIWAGTGLLRCDTALLGPVKIASLSRCLLPNLLKESVDVLVLGVFHLD